MIAGRSGPGPAGSFQRSACRTAASLASRGRPAVVVPVFGHLERQRGQPALRGQVLHDGAVRALVRGLVVHLAEQHHVGLHQVLHARHRRASGAQAASVSSAQAAAPRKDGAHASILSASRVPLAPHAACPPPPVRILATLALALAAACWAPGCTPRCPGCSVRCCDRPGLGARRADAELDPPAQCRAVVIGTRWACTSRRRSPRWWAALVGDPAEHRLGAVAGLGLRRLAAPAGPTQPARHPGRAARHQLLRVGHRRRFRDDLLAERAGARSDLVAAAHSLRLLIVTLLVPVAITASGLHGVDATLPGPAQRRAARAAPAGLGRLGRGWLMARTGRANPWFIGALAVAMGLTMSGIELSAVPQPLTNAAQLVIGVSLGVRFQRRVRAHRAALAAGVGGRHRADAAVCALFGVGWPGWRD
jgi:hypothetical protein